MPYSSAKIAIPKVTGNIVITATAIQSAAPINILNTVGYQNNKRISLSSQNADKTVDGTGTVATGPIPVSLGDVVRASGFSFNKLIIALFDSSDVFLTGNNQMGNGSSQDIANIGSISIDENGILTYIYNENTNNKTAFIRFSGKCTDGANAIVTINEELD